MDVKTIRSPKTILHKATIKRKVRMLSLKLTPKFTLVFMSTTQHMRDADLSLKPKARKKTQLLRILGYMKAKNPFFFSKVCIKEQKLLQYSIQRTKCLVGEIQNFPKTNNLKIQKEFKHLKECLSFEPRSALSARSITCALTQSFKTNFKRVLA